MIRVSEVYGSRAVREFGEALGKAIGYEKDYASLTDLAFAQNKQDFAEAVYRFLRRFHTMATRPENQWYCPSASVVEELMGVVDNVAEKLARVGNVEGAVGEREAVRLVRAAVLSRALAEATYARIQMEKRAGSQAAQSDSQEANNG